ncbi:hypothetical protein BGZ65_006516 [Modicella reniformis]|uniref:Uncharacterized protein n=1 Tax=Modicella reniformis TaxID=1440133 RepID=A0A9P6MB55_9FUNG|nr:hypothetical protein BGZ65_006516 [Modicella reniformis]
MSTLTILRVRGSYLSLDDLVHESSRELTTSGSREPFVPPSWVCSKLQELMVYIEKPVSKTIVHSFLEPRDKRGSSINAYIGKLAISIAFQVGGLCKALKSLKALKTLSIFWKRAVYRTIRSISFEYADGQLRKKKEMLIQLALKERTGLDRRFVHTEDSDDDYAEPEDLDLDLDWPLDVDRKKFHKSGKLYLRQSLRGGAEWFNAYPKE